MLNKLSSVSWVKFYIESQKISREKDHVSKGESLSECNAWYSNHCREHIDHNECEEIFLFYVSHSICYQKAARKIEQRVTMQFTKILYCLWIIRICRVNGVRICNPPFFDYIEWNGLISLENDLNPTAECSIKMLLK